MPNLSVTVQPLEPPFNGSVTFFKFEGEDRLLAVSSADGDAIRKMLSGTPEGRVVVLEAAPDGERIVVSVLLH